MGRHTARQLFARSSGSRRSVYVRSAVYAVGVMVLLWLAAVAHKSLAHRQHATQPSIPLHDLTWPAPPADGSLRTHYRCLPLEPGFTNPNFTTCEFRNLVLWDGQLYVVNPDLHAHKLPTVNADWFTTNTVPLAYAPSLAALPAPPSAPHLRVSRAVIAGFSFYHNFYHAFAEYAPSVHSLVCRLWGDCAWQPASNLQLVMANKPSILPEHLHRPVSATAMQCVTALPVLHLWHKEYEDRVVVLESALLGFGPECRADEFHCLPWEQRRPPTIEMMRSWRQRVADCIGFDASRQVPVDPPRIVVVDRPYESGRHFVNIEKVMAHLRAKYGHFADAHLHYMEAKSMAEQAAIFNNASVIIWNHGAAMGNLIYAPVNAVALQVVFMPSPSALFAWPEQLVRDLPHNVTLLHAVNTDPDNLLQKAGWVRLGDTYKRLTPQEKLAVWEKKQCPTAYGEDVKIECDEFWVKIAGSLELDVAVLDKQLEPVMDRFASLSKRSR